MGGCPNYGPFLGTLNIRGHIIIGTQKGTIILTTTHIPLFPTTNHRVECSAPDAESYLDKHQTLCIKAKEPRAAQQKKWWV